MSWNCNLAVVCCGSRCIVRRLEDAKHKEGLRSVYAGELTRTKSPAAWLDVAAHTAALASLFDASVGAELHSELSTSIAPCSERRAVDA